MLIIHPKDRTTAMLSALYDGVPEARLLDCTLRSKAFSRELHHTPPSERIMLLGHGCEKGLYWREDALPPAEKLTRKRVTYVQTSHKETTGLF